MKRNPAVNVDQIHSLLGGEELRRLLDRLRKRMSCGEPLTGRIHLNNATTAEQRAFAKLMGRLPRHADSLIVDLDKLSAILVRAKACPRLEDAVIAIVGPIVNNREQALTRRMEWDRLWSEAVGRLESKAALLRWLDHLKTRGLLKRLVRSDLQKADALLKQAIAIVEQIPFPSVRLAELAASTTGNSHALDPGRSLAALVIRFARQLDPSTRWRTAAERRDAWETLGILCDEVSAPVLVLNLPARPGSLTAEALNLHASAGEPYRVSVRQLRRHPPVFDTELCQEVFVCENPTVVDVAANKLGNSCRPLICIDGQPKTASRLLLDLLKAAGVRIRYHGDFDWDGIRIANTVMERHGATSWRFDAADYARAHARARYPLKGRSIRASWDINLSELMMQTGRCAHEEEESVLNLLLTDLACH